MVAGFLLLAAPHGSSSSESVQTSHVEKDFFLSSLEKELLEEINLARLSPENYRYILEQNRIYYRGKRLEKPGRIPIVTKEGIAALDEAIDYLGGAQSSPPLALSQGMSLGARDLVNEQQISGAVGHAGGDGKGTDDRVNRYGIWGKSIGEDIEYGSDEARTIVTNLLVDDGVPDRGHRTNLMNPDFTVIGVACGAHRIYRHMCVITFAGSYSEKP